MLAKYESWGKIISDSERRIDPETADIRFARDRCDIIIDADGVGMQPSAKHEFEIITLDSHAVLIGLKVLCIRHGGKQSCPCNA